MAANVNVAAAAAAAAPVVAAPAVQLAGFALSPARAVAGVIDMSSSAGSKLFVTQPGGTVIFFFKSSSPIKISHNLLQKMSL
jgi:hypothetical protein